MQPEDALVLVLALLVHGGLCANLGKFWHITDHHWDPYYSQFAQDPLDVCPSSYGRVLSNPGPLGDYKCDAPWKLIQSSIDAMKRFDPNPDFILWTGDDTLHTENQDKYLGKKKVVEIIGNISIAIREAFPKTPIFPALGNHDYHPGSQIPPGGSEILTAIAEIWKPWLSSDAYASFKKEGFYKDFIPGSKKHVMMILNSNFWYNFNKAVNSTGDPGEEFHWMDQSLAEAAEKSQKDFTQYYLDLDAANNKRQNGSVGLWKEEYRATSKYGMSDIMTPSWGKLATSMRQGCERNDSECPRSFIEYHKMNSVSYNIGECERRCQKFQLCAITEVESSNYELCMSNWGNYGTRTQPSIWCTFVTPLVFLLRRMGLDTAFRSCMAKNP